jgi:hypothetical protein
MHSLAVTVVDRGADGRLVGTVGAGLVPILGMRPGDRAIHRARITTPGPVSTCLRSRAGGVVDTAHGQDGVPLGGVGRP